MSGSEATGGERAELRTLLAALVVLTAVSLGGVLGAVAAATQPDVVDDTAARQAPYLPCCRPALEVEKRPEKRAFHLVLWPALVLGAVAARRVFVSNESPACDPELVLRLVGPAVVLSVLAGAAVYAAGHGLGPGAYGAAAVAVQRLATVAFVLVALRARKPFLESLALARREAAP